MADAGIEPSTQEPHAMRPDELTEDHILGGRVRLLQPRRGYRAATDPVLLAASVPARPGERVLDLGCGVGAASLCLTARSPGLDLHGLELQQDYAALARDNAGRNGAALTVHEGDAAQPPPALKSLSFDHVMLNPPYHARDAAIASPIMARDLANREGDLDLAGWIDAALRRLRPGGWMTIIQRAERAPEILAALLGKAGDARLLPLQPREGRPAKRVLIGARKGARGPFGLLAPLVLHAGATHEQDEDDATEAARAVLKGGAPIDLHVRG